MKTVLYTMPILAILTLFCSSSILADDRPVPIVEEEVIEEIDEIEEIVVVKSETTIGFLELLGEL